MSSERRSGRHYAGNPRHAGQPRWTKRTPLWVMFTPVLFGSLAVSLHHPGIGTPDIMSVSIAGLMILLSEKSV